MNGIDKQWIKNIPKFESSDGRRLKFSDEFIKNKLYKALTNKEIICLARGEGRSFRLNDIILHPEILFDWGEKSMHAFLDNTQDEVRKFCDPRIINKERIIYYIEQYSNELKGYYRKYKYFECNDYDVNNFVENLILKVSIEESSSVLLCIKDWIIYALHTMGISEFKKISPCISCSYGEDRFKKAIKFGWGRRPYNKYCVIMDNWIHRHEEGIAYRRMKYVNEVLNRYGLKWFSNKHNEIMLKYGIFPQKLVGYYLLDRNLDNKINKYVINKHYVDKWEEDEEFEIGQSLYFDQKIDFEKLGMYNTIYQYDGQAFTIAGRRN